MKIKTIGISWALMFSSYGYGQTNGFQFVNGVKGFKEEVSKLSHSSGPGFALQVLHRDSVIFSFATGQADVKTQQPIDQATPFYVASVGKTMTAAAILLLRQEKKLQLQDFIGQYIPGLPPSTQPIRIYHLLYHLSGLPDYYDLYGEELHDFYNSNVLEFVRKTDSVQFEPGVDYAYSNTAYVLLSMIIEKVSGNSFGAFLRHRFFQPLMMQETTVIDQPGIEVKGRAVGYSVDSLKKYHELDYKDVFTTGAGGIYSTTNDLVKWVNGLLSGKVIGKRMLDLMFDFPRTYSGAKSYLGMGWNNESYGPRTPEWNGLRAYGSFGVMKGFRSAIIYLPDQELTLVLLGNSTQTDLLGEKLIRHFIQKK